uniref:Uncharacterized protein n=1 Tax=Setaria viridis TaxID=4556 RepID=A0A4U6T6K2_SETVI|nr:hypothetical protein SEVIR_9G492150v2 [Setaria viridis]
MLLYLLLLGGCSCRSAGGQAPRQLLARRHAATGATAGGDLARATRPRLATAYASARGCCGRRRRRSLRACAGKAASLAGWPTVATKTTPNLSCSRIQSE